MGGDYTTLKVVLEPSDEGGFTVYVPSLPGCISEGNTKEEALANIREAIAAYLQELGDELNPNQQVLITEVEVELPTPAQEKIPHG